MAPLITLTQAKQHLRMPLTQTNLDDDLTVKIAAASAIVLDYLRRPAGEWEAGSPGSPGGGSPQDDEKLTIVQAAICLVLGNLWAADRGDKPKDNPDGPITPGVERLLARLRDPAIA